MNFANIRNNEIIDMNSKYLDTDIIRVEVSDEIYQAYLEDRNKVIYLNGEIILNPNYEEEQKQKEKARIQELAMTRSDFFDGTIQAWGVGQDELLALIQTLLATLPLPDVKKLIAINNFKNALNFYRKHDLFNILVGMPIQLADNIQLVIENEHLDKFFDEVNKGNKETAWQYLPAPVMIQVEEVTEQVSEQVDYTSEQVSEQVEVEDENTSNTTI